MATSPLFCLPSIPSLRLKLTFATDEKQSGMLVRYRTHCTMPDFMARFLISGCAMRLFPAMTALYSAIGLLVGTSILVGVVALLQWQYSSLPVVLGFAGACALLYGSLLLVREARLALLTTVKEVAFAREAALGGEQEREG
jgi:hypothetical protein